MKTIGDQQLVKRINRSVILRLVRAQPGLSRAQLAGESGLTKSTVSMLARELIEEGWLAEASGPTSSGMGRPSTPLVINDTARGLLGVELAVDCLRVVGVTLLGEVVHSLHEPLHSREPARVCQQLAAMVAKAHQQLVARGLQPLGLGVGLPGAFDEATGLVWFAPNLAWRHVDILPQIIAALAAVGVPPMPVHVQNDADTGALSEYEFASDSGKTALVFVACSVGVGAGTNIGHMGKGDAILVVASDLYEEAPIWWLRVKQAADRGATLIVVNPRATKLDKFAKFTVIFFK